MRKINFKAVLIPILGLLVACSSPEKKEEDPQFYAKKDESGTVITKELTYQSSGELRKGFMALPAGEGPFPAVLVVHEWWGQTDYPRERAKKLAQEGYVALAVDLYGEGKTADHPKDAMAFSKKVMSDLDGAQANIETAIETLKKESKVDGTKIAALGYCFGGAIVLEMARRGLNLEMVASYHGNLSPIIENEVKPIRTRMLIFNGGSDPFVKKEALEKARANLKKAKVRYKLVNYKNAKHGFTNPAATEFGKKFNLPLAYSKKADDASWSQTLKAFKVVFK